MTLESIDSQPRTWDECLPNHLLFFLLAWSHGVINKLPNRLKLDIMNSSDVTVNKYVTARSFVNNCISYVTNSFSPVQENHAARAIRTRKFLTIIRLKAKCYNDNDLQFALKHYPYIKNLESPHSVRFPKELVRASADYSICRLSPRDLLTIFSSQPNLLILFSHHDLIFITNLILFVNFFPHRQDIIAALAALSLTDFIKACKHITKLVKEVHPNLLPSVVDLAELQNLVGFQNPPFPEFDLFSEMEKFANAGTLEHGPSTDRFTYPFFRSLWLTSLNLFVPTNAVSPYDKSLVEFLNELDFDETVGTSDLFRIVYKDGNKTIRRKARKNQIKFFLEPTSLQKDLLNESSWVCSAIEKYELSKIRLAVANPTYVFLIEQYLKKFIQKWDKNIEIIKPSTNILDEVILHRYLCELPLYFLPWDYAQGDHQITNLEMTDCINLLLQAHNFTNPDIAWCKEKWISLLQNRYLTSPNLPDVKLRVKGGLPSGTNFTADFWNWISPAYFTTCSTLGKVRPVKSKIKGDDSIFGFSDPLDGVVLRQLYACLGLQAGVGKFGITQNYAEFLRTIHYHPSNRTFGYPGRAIPLLVQRRPWKSPNVNFLEKLKTLFEQIGTVVRRGGCEIYAFKLGNSLISNAGRFGTIFSKLAQTSPRNGGWGLLLATDSKISVATYDVVSEGALVLRFSDQLQSDVSWSGSVAVLTNLATKFSISLGPVTHGQAVAFAKKRLVTRLRSGDFPGLTELMREAWDTSILSYRFRRADQPTVNERLRCLQVFRETLGYIVSLIGCWPNTAGFDDYKAFVSELDSLSIPYIQEAAELYNPPELLSPFRVDYKIHPKVRGQVQNALASIFSTYPDMLLNVSFNDLYCSYATADTLRSFMY